MKQFLWFWGGVRQLVISEVNTGGVNNSGRIVFYRRGSFFGRRRSYRIVDFLYKYVDVPAIVRRIEFDRHRRGFVVLGCFVTGVLSYTLAAAAICLGDIFVIGHYRYLGTSIGDGSFLLNFLRRSYIFGVSSCIRAQGSFGKFFGVYSWFYSVLQMPSGEERFFFNNNIGRIGFGFFNKVFFEDILKAGRNVLLGKKPVVRGVAMNPIDHPHGGGEGKCKGRCSVSPWGWLTKSARKRVFHKFVFYSRKFGQRK